MAFKLTSKQSHMDCELCGVKDAHRVALVEGIKLILCDRCVKTGREVRETPVFTKSGITIKKKPRAEDTIVSDYAVQIKKARQRRGIEQKDLARELNEKQSIISKVENGSMTPTIALAKKIERFLGLTLVEKTEQGEFKSDVAGDGLTLGDVLKIK